MRLYNTLTRKVEEFEPINPPHVGIYSCGPTVYWFQHIGHMYAYVQWDSLVRALRYQGFDVKWVMNMTDVGHMTSDEDLGEDKMEKGAKREGISVWELADKYIAQFKESLSLLNISSPDILCRATDYIPEQIDLIKKIEANGFTYRTKKGIVFDTSKFPHYADFGNLKLNKQENIEASEADPEKKQPWDFYLWAFNDKHLMQWDSPWGRGYPGWHVECTAMSVKNLGENFDIHTGGIDHIAVHHTDEIAQGYGAFGHQTAKFWLHNAHLLGKGGEKMSKSLGNFLLVQELQNKGFEPLAHRYLILNSHYRKGSNFTWEALEGAQNALTKLRQKAQKLDSQGLSLRTQFLDAINDDLNMPEALAVAWKTESREDLVEFDKVLGLDLFKVEEEKVIPEEIRKLMEERDKLRAEKKYEEADKLRQQIEEKGFKIKDLPAGRQAMLPNDTNK